MTVYNGILEKKLGSLWGVSFPDLSGCIAAAEAADETIAQAGEAPGERFALRGDIGFREGMAGGDVAIVLRPPGGELELDDTELRAIDAATERRGLSPSGFVRGLVLERLAG